MSEDLVIEGTVPGPAAPRPKAQRSPVLFLLVNLFAFFAGMTSVIGLTAGFSRIGLWFAFVPALLLGGVLPVFLVARASAALKRRNLKVVLRHIINFSLYLIIHAAIFGVVLDWFDRSRADYAAAAHTLVSTFGEVPWVSGILKKSSEDARIVFGAPTRAQAPERPAGDAGPTPDDAGPTGGLDAGPAPVAAATGTQLSERKPGGRVVRRAIYVVKTDAGDPGVVVVSVEAGGGHKAELLSLAAHADSGSPTSASVASDGSVAVVLGGARLLVRGPGERLGVVRALTRNGMLKLGDDTGQVRRIADVIVGPKGSAVAVVEVIVTLEGGAGDVRQALVSLQGGAEINRLRMTGDPLPDNAEDVTDAFLLRRPTASGAYCVAEAFRQGGASVAVDTSAEKFQVNPERLLCGHIDNPGALVEVSRTDAAAGGVPDRAVQRYYDAFSLQDGRALTQANFVEAGRETWVFLADVRAGTRVLAPWDKEGSPWPRNATDLEAEPEGGFAWIDGDALVVGTVSKHKSARRLTALNALEADSTPIGAAAQPRAPRLTRGGDFVLLLADVAPSGQRPRAAVLLASEADLSAGLAEEILSVGDALSGVKLREISPPPSRVTRR